MARYTTSKNIVRFERLGYLTILFGGIAGVLANWQVTVKSFTQYPALSPIIFVIFSTMQIGWVWVIAHKRQSWGRWVTLAFTIAHMILVVISPWASIISAVPRFQTNPPLAMVQLVVDAAWLVALYFSFTGDAKAWFIFPRSPEFDSRPASPSEA